MALPSALDTRPSMHRAHDVAQAQALTAGLSPAYLAYAIAKHEGNRQLAYEAACAQLVAAPSSSHRPLRLGRLGLPQWIWGIARAVRPSQRRASSPAVSSS